MQPPAPKLEPIPRPKSWIRARGRRNLREVVRRLELHSADLNREREELLRWQEEAYQEEKLAQKVYQHIVARGLKDAPGVHRMVSPRSMFNGDMVLAASGPGGLLRMMVGDFTGHGLSAAIGSLPASEVFYSMTQKGFSVSDVVSELNKKLLTLLPRGMFCAAVIWDVDQTTGQMSVWNGGMHDVLIQGPLGLRDRLQSRHPPLGILPVKDFRSDTENRLLHVGDRILAYSDGVLDASNDARERFGQERLERTFLSSNDAEGFFCSLIDGIAAHCGVAEQVDDITLIEYDVQPLQPTPLASSADLASAPEPSTWQFEVTLGPDALRSTDPVPMVVDAIMNIQGLHGDRRRISTIVAELYSNALHHGLLRVDSSLRCSPAGFAAYFDECKSRLATLQEGQIRISLQHRPRSDGGTLDMVFEDTGEGFDHTAPRKPSCAFGGRGRTIVQSLCEDVRYEGRGNRVLARYRWRFGGPEAVD
ncbi:MAG: serine/threonine-protein phosphatase [Deltaproteobacteria bacterium]|nr:serine/threonine-protein phosphatase [Deltaproteobacteria bacterium]